MKIDEIMVPSFAEELNNTRVIGIDIGSRASKGVLLYDGNLYCTMIPSGVSSKETALKVFTTLCETINIKPSKLSYAVITGYGRVSVELPDIEHLVLTEISCHALGAHYLNPKTRTILDIGGQDSKAIKLDPKTGKVVEFIMNDKCAAGTGRFLEKVAQLLELDLTDLGKMSLLSQNPVEISSQCVVFAESEVISWMARGATKEDVAAGIHLATARRVRNLLRRIGMEDTLLFTGGVSNNPGMRKAVQEVLGMMIGHSALDTTYAGALGAAIFAKHYAEGETALVMD